MNNCGQLYFDQSLYLSISVAQLRVVRSGGLFGQVTVPYEVESDGEEGQLSIPLILLTFLAACSCLISV